MEVLAFCAVTGFAAAGAVASFYQWVTSEPADFRISDFTWRALSVSVLLCVAAGPFIVARRVREAFAARNAQLVPVIFGVTVCGLWSACAGTLFLSVILFIPQ
ncbi:hypothetical protein CLD20_15245 [Afifella sp. IM 167]|nr:hypothetical protein [Afifella sp. IM 167]